MASILKVFGTETELRCDSHRKKAQAIIQVVPKKFDTKYPRAHGEDDYLLPAQIVEQALELCRGVSGSSRDAYVSRASQHRGMQSEEAHAHAVRSVEEHLAEYARQGNVRASREQEFQKRFGLSGGYICAGHRIYVDGTHPEVSTPECANPRDAVLYERSAMEIMRAGADVLEQKVPSVRVNLYKDNSDGKGRSWGAHENYLITSDLFEELASYETKSLNASLLNYTQAVWMSFLVSRLIYAGSGKLMEEGGSRHMDESPKGEDMYQGFVISQRAEFMKYFAMLDTINNRALINTRDISYIDQSFGRRLHVIVGDANMCDVAVYLKIGMAAIVLMMLEDRYHEHVSSWPWPTYAHPIDALKVVSRDVSLQAGVPAKKGPHVLQISALAMQRFFLNVAQEWFRDVCVTQHPPDKVAWIPEVLAMLDGVLTRLEHNRSALFGQIDWITKYILCDRVLVEHQRTWKDVYTDTFIQVRGKERPLKGYMDALCASYHLLGERSLFHQLDMRGDIRRLVSADEVRHAMVHPPSDTRAFTRSQYLHALGPYIDSINWSYLNIHHPSQGHSIIYLRSPWRVDHVQ